MLVGDVHRETMRLVELANSLGVPWKAVHIAVNEDSGAEDPAQVAGAGRHGRTRRAPVALPQRDPAAAPLCQAAAQHNPGGFVHVVLGELRTGNPMAQVLHQNAHLIEQLALSDLDGVLTSVVPFPLESYEHEEWMHEELEEITLTLPQPSSPQYSPAQPGQLPAEQLPADLPEVERI